MERTNEDGSISDLSIVLVERSLSDKPFPTAGEMAATA